MLIVFGLYSRVRLCIPQASPSPRQSESEEVAQLSNAVVDALRSILMVGIKEQRCNSELVEWHDIYIPEKCADEWMQNNADFKWLCHEWFHHVRHHIHGCHSIGSFAIIIWRLNNFTVSFHGDVRGESGVRKLTSVNRKLDSVIYTWLIFKKMPAWF